MTGYALGAAEHVAEATPRAQRASVLGRRRGDPACAEPERHRALVVGITVRAVVREQDEFARLSEGVRASRADRKGRAGLASEFADQPEPRLAGHTRLDLEGVEQEVAVAVGSAGGPIHFSTARPRRTTRSRPPKPTGLPLPAGRREFEFRIRFLDARPPWIASRRRNGFIRSCRPLRAAKTRFFHAGARRIVLRIGALHRKEHRLHSQFGGSECA